MTGGREHQGSSCRGVGVVRLEPFDPSSGSGRGLLAESSNAEDVRPKATARFDLAFFWIARWCVAFVPGAYPACVEIKQCVGCTRQFFTKSYLGDDAAVLAPSSGEEPASPRHRAGVASMAGRTT